MKSILSLGFILFALSFCGLSDKLKGLTGSPSANANTASSSSSPNSSSTSSTTTEKAKLTASQQAIVDGGTETKWEEQGISWKLPSGWSKMDVKKESFNYKSPDNAFFTRQYFLSWRQFPDGYQPQSLLRSSDAAVKERQI